MTAVLLPLLSSLLLAAPPAPAPKPEPIEPLLDALEGCQDTDCAPLRALVARGEAVWPDLEKGLDHPKELVRFWSIGVLSEVPVPAAKGRLLSLLATEPLARLRAASAFALASYKEGPEVGLAIVDALADIDPNVRFEAASALGRRAPEVAARDGLVKVLSDQDEDVRAAAAESLGLMGAIGQTPEVASALLAKVSDRKPAVRGRVAIALGQLRVVAAVGPLVKRLERERDETALAAAVWTLGELGDKAATDPLKALAAHPSEVVRQHAAEALAKLAATK